MGKRHDTAHTVFFILFILCQSYGQSPEKLKVSRGRFARQILKEALAQAILAMASLTI